MPMDQDTRNRFDNRLGELIDEGQQILDGIKQETKYTARTPFWDSYDRKSGGRPYTVDVADVPAFNTWRTSCQTFLENLLHGNPVHGDFPGLIATLQANPRNIEYLISNLTSFRNSLNRGELDGIFTVEDPQTVPESVEQKDDEPSTTEPTVVKSTSSATILDRDRLRVWSRYREQIDPAGIVVGNSPLLLEIFSLIHDANEMKPQIDRAPAVLLLGEPGVGKSYIARLIHDSSSRAEQPYREVTAGGTGGDPNMQRGEWIGYGRNHGVQGVEPGGRAGHIIKALGGTLFVDEFDMLSLDLQGIFLSVLEGRPIQRVGGESFTPDVRCIFATNADIDDAVRTGRLRKDLLARIWPRITIPPLSARKGDIVALASHFLQTDKTLSTPTKLALLQHDWPDNVRELRNAIELAVAHAGSAVKRLDVDHFKLPDPIVQQVRSLSDDDVERELWVLADRLARSEGSQTGQGLQRRAGEILGVSETRASRMYGKHITETQ